MQTTTTYSKMTVILYIFFFFCAVRLAVSLTNMVTRPYLPEARNDIAGQKVSVLVPARNEEHNIGRLLSDLCLMQDEIYEILVYDDMSDDRTAQTVEQWAQKFPKIKLIPGSEKPEGWLGKNHACHKLAQSAKGDWLLFLDADVRIHNHAVSRALTCCRDHELQLLSVFPRQEMPDLGTRLAVPLMNVILLSLLPLIAVRKAPQSSLSAANGQFMCFPSDIYRRTEPHSKHRTSTVEDMAIVESYKKSGLRVATLLGYNDVSCRMYDNLKSAVEGFSKNIFRFFGGSAVLCILFALVTTVAPFLYFIAGRYALGIAYIIMVILTRIFISVSSRQSVALNILLIIPQQFILWKIIFTALLRKKRKELYWKGRNVYSNH